MLFDDTYAGLRYRYGLQYRPARTAQVPAGWIVFSDRPHADYRFGTLDWPEPLSPEAVARFELVGPLEDTVTA